MRQSKKESSTKTLSRIKQEMNVPRITKSARSSVRAEALFENHQFHLGLYKRVADRLGVDASYVSKVASGARNSQSIMRILLKELTALQ